jgi:hypothetical protein
MQPFVVVAILILGLLVLLGLLGEYKFIVLGREGFMAKVPAPSVVTPLEPVENEEPLLGASLDLSLPLTSDRLIAQTVEESSENWGRMTSEKCFRYDMGEPLTKTRNYLQRTNNYSRSHPDSCSAPNHEFVGTFYRPHEGVGATPATGLPLPAGATGADLYRALARTNGV